MRLYGRKFAARFTGRQVKARTETRDAILWDIDENNYRCRVKIQGSNEYVVAHYPRNWTQIPYWLKPGCAVRILHRSGVRGYVEVIGEGRAIPTPVEGSSFPTEQDQTDMILTGLEMTETDPVSMAVYVSHGTYRIDGTVYSPDEELFSPAIVMDDPAPMVMGEGTEMNGLPAVMGLQGVIMDLDAAPGSGYMRYDAFYIGADGEVQYIKGTAAYNDPAKPDIPEGYLLIGDYILVKSGATAIYDEDIGAEFETRVPSELDIASDAGEGEYGMAWDSEYGDPGHPIATNDITVTVLDQYGQSISNGTTGWPIEASLMFGTGYMNPSNGENTANPSCEYTYSRYQQMSAEDDPETGPIMMAFEMTDDSYPLIEMLQFDILDEYGEPIIGEVDRF